MCIRDSYQHFADMMGASANRLPRLTINLFSGGKHAGQQVSVQDVLIIPMSARTIDEVLVTAFDVYPVSYTHLDVYKRQEP